MGEREVEEGVREEGVREEGKEEVAAEERKGEEREEKGRGGRELRLFMCSLMMVRKRMKLLLRNREVSEGLEFYLMSRVFVCNCTSSLCIELLELHL